MQDVFRVTWFFVDLILAEGYAVRSITVYRITNSNVWLRIWQR